MLIFDLDGTLINTISDLAMACNYALRQCGFSEHAEEEYPRLVGNGISRLILRALPEEKQDEETLAQAKAHFLPYYFAHCYEHSFPYEGIPELIDTLRKKKIPLAVASNKYQEATEKIINHFFPNSFVAIHGERSGVARKPDPTIVKNILKECHAIEEETLYIGDSVIDIQTAKAAGIRIAACTWGFVGKEQLRKEEPTFIVDSPKEIEILLANNLLKR